MASNRKTFLPEDASNQNNEDNNNNSNLSDLERLPTDIARVEIAPKLDTKDLETLVSVSKTMNHLFRPELVRRLFNYVLEANYSEAEKMVRANPSLIFEHLRIEKKKKDKDGNWDGRTYEYETLSPLKLAFKLLDTHMWKMFLEIIVGKKVHILKDFPNDLAQYKDNHILVSGQLYSVNADGKSEIKNPKLFKFFMQQLEEQKDHINLESMFTEYNTFIVQREAWKKKEISDQLINEALLNLGKAQRDIPAHMLSEFCRQRKRQDINTQGANSIFNVNIEAPPTDSNIYNYMNDREESVLPLTLNRGLGYDFALLRARPQGETFRVMACDDIWLMEFLRGANPSSDLTIFRQLDQTRNEDLGILRPKVDLNNSNSATNAKDRRTF